MIITKEFLHDTLDYFEGNLIWKKSIGRLAKKGRIAGTINQNGYLSICLLGKIYKLHRIIFFYHHGYFPKVVDHIDGNKVNNKIENLREASISQNAWNSKIRITNKSGVKGISWDKKANKWRASCTVNYKQNNLGCFEDIEEAKKVIKNFRNLHHKEFSKHY